MELTAVEMALAMEVAVKQTNNFRNSLADSGMHYVRSPHPLKSDKAKETVFPLRRGPHLAKVPI